VIRAFARLVPVLAALAMSCGPRATDGTHGGRVYFGSLATPHRQVLRFNLGTEPEMRDPGVMSGQPDGRFARLVFEGLVTNDPQTLEPRPGQAYRWEESADGLTLTFHLRPGLQWSDGTPLTARDFVWSWRRVLSPRTASRNAALLYPLRNGERFHRGELEDSTQVGVAAPDDSTLVVTLESPTAYFTYLAAFYTLVPVPRHVVERHGVRWTRREHMVGNGPFLWTYWRQNERYEFQRNPRFWNAQAVRLEKVVAYTVDDLNTSTNLYKSGVLDWNPSGYIPSPYLPHMTHYADFRRGRYQGTYFYSVNCTREPFDDPWVRRALNLAIDRQAIARDLLKNSRDPWGRITPTGYPGYAGPEPVTYQPEKARECLAKAGFPGGRGFPKFSILFNTSEDHKRIAEAIQAMWKRTLGVDVELQSMEWGSYLQATTALEYDVARRSWIGDYLDPNTFLATLATGDGNNRTGWSSARYDDLLRRASRELDPARRFALLEQAEALALDEAPFLPIYHYSTNELVKPWVRGIHQTALDVHPLTYVWIDPDWRQHEPIAGEDAR
jgi:ABC-type oligopeptide transport system substrate-binding subunit